MDSAIVRAVKPGIAERNFLIFWYDIKLNYLETTDLRPKPEIQNTLNLPKTSFSIKANLPQREPLMLKHWDEIDSYGRMRAARVGRPSYVPRGTGPDARAIGWEPDKPSNAAGPGLNKRPRRR
jgi:hypothetical protein